MDYKHHLHPDRLERYSFLWSEARLVIAAIALFIGGRPPLLSLLGGPSWRTAGSVWGILVLCWLISGVASAYLFYRWLHTGKRVFGGRNHYDLASFFVSVVSGINLGLAALLGRNIGMSIFPYPIFFVIAGLIYLAAAWHLYSRWKAHGERLFS